jgi:hypothetical protein
MGADGLDADWAYFARQVPGGFAGYFYEDHQPVLMLTRPHEAAAAKAALVNRVRNFPIATAAVRRARWNFAQLVEWDSYLRIQDVWQSAPISGVDRDEVANRIMFGVPDEAARRSLALRLTMLDLPCDLVIIRIMPFMPAL